MQPASTPFVLAIISMFQFSPNIANQPTSNDFQEYSTANWPLSTKSNHFPTYQYKPSKLQYTKYQFKTMKTLINLTQRHYFSKYHKFKITRLPGQHFITLIKDQTSLNQLINIIQHQFTNNQLLASPIFTTELDIFPVTQELKNINEQYQTEPFLPMLLAGQLYLYQIKKDKALLIYGIECLELNHTNNRNLPQRLQIGIINLHNQWQSARTISEALIAPLIPSNSPELTEQKQQFNRTLEKVSTNWIMMNNLKMHNPINEFVKKLTLTMAANWIFLYIITFGYYGWDVGEPVSYIETSIFELLALLRFFNLQQKLNQEVAVNQGRWMGLLNLTANRRMQFWLQCYLRRQIY